MHNHIGCICMTFLHFFLRELWQKSLGLLLQDGEELCREGVQEAVWFGCGFVSFLFHLSRIDNFAYFLIFLVLSAALFLSRNLA